METLRLFKNTQWHLKDTVHWILQYVPLASFIKKYPFLCRWTKPYRAKIALLVMKALHWSQTVRQFWTNQIFNFVLILTLLFAWLKRNHIEKRDIYFLVDFKNLTLTLKMSNQVQNRARWWRGQLIRFLRAADILPQLPVEKA